MKKSLRTPAPESRDRSVEEHRRRGRAVARLGKGKLTPHPKGRRFCGISFSLSKRAELALALLILALFTAIAAFAQPAEWTARWIDVPETSGQEHGVYHVRRTFDLPAQPATFHRSE